MSSARCGLGCHTRSPGFLRSARAALQGFCFVFRSGFFVVRCSVVCVVEVNAFDGSDAPNFTRCCGRVNGAHPRRIGQGRRVGTAVKTAAVSEQSRAPVVNVGVWIARGSEVCVVLGSTKAMQEGSRAVRCHFGERENNVRVHFVFCCPRCFVGDARVENHSLGWFRPNRKNHASVVCTVLEGSGPMTVWGYRREQELRNQQVKIAKERDEARREGYGHNLFRLRIFTKSVHSIPWRVCRALGCEGGGEAGDRGQGGGCSGNVIFVVRRVARRRRSGC